MKLVHVHSLAMLACLGCVDAPWQDDHDFEWRGEHVTIYGYDRDAEQACGESLRATDDEVRTLLDFHGSDADVHIDYRWLSQSFWDEVGLVEVEGLHSQGEVTSVQLAQDHELSHAVSWNLHGRTCTHVLEEGLAVVLDDAYPSFSDPVEFDRSIEDLLVFAGQASSSEYEQAGHFVAFLLETRGIEGFDALCEFIPRLTVLTLEDWDAAFQAVFGSSLDDILAAYATYPVCSHHQYRARLADCAGEPDVIVSETEDTEFSFRLGCDESDVIGEVDGTMMLVRRVYTEVPGYYDVQVDDGSSEREVVLIHEQCTTCSQRPLVGRVDDIELPEGGSACTWIESPSECGYQPLSGMHSFVFFLDEGLDRDVTVRIVPTGLDLP